MRDLKSEILEFIDGRSILILGFGKEGRATYSMLRNYFPQLQICISDKNVKISNDCFISCDPFITYELGDLHMDNLSGYDLIFKSPGVSLKQYDIPKNQYITSQTDLFLKLFGNQIIGVTGTKGKSTTVSLIHHFLKSNGKKCLLVGNIGVPAFDVMSLIEDDSIIVYELSSHQLEFVSHSPHIAVFLNLFEEHLDHYDSYLSYQKAKANITKFQNENDILIISSDDQLVMKRITELETLARKILISRSESNGVSYIRGDEIFLSNNRHYSFEANLNPLIGKHNTLNILFALNACNALGLEMNRLIKSIYSFKSLPHRLEVVGTFNGVEFVNDSIATIPEATILAIQSFDNLGTLILGGFNRGIDYSSFVEYLIKNEVKNLILLGQVGNLLNNELIARSYQSNIFIADNMDEVIELAYQHTKRGKTCLLSPAASSYDHFLNFEDRGDQYKKKVTDYIHHL